MTASGSCQVDLTSGLGFPRIWSFVAAFLVLLGVGGAWSAVGTAAQATQPSCTDSWVGARSGNWQDPADWSTGAVPGNGDVACITAAGTYTVTLSGQAGAGALVLGGSSGTQTLALTAGAQSCFPTDPSQGTSPCFSGLGSTAAYLNLQTTSYVLPRGVFELTATRDPVAPATTGGVAAYTSPASVALVNSGTIVSAPTAYVSQPRQIIGFVENRGTIDIDAPTTGAISSHGVTITNAGAFNVSSRGSFTLADNGSSFVNQSGSVTNHGTFLDAASNPTTGFVEATGATSGNPIRIETSLDFTGAGRSSFDAIGYPTLTGSIAADQSVAVDADGGYTDAGYTAPATVNGTLEIINNGKPSSSDTAALTMHGTGPLTVGPKGRLIFNAADGGARQFFGSIVNEGTVDVQAVPATHPLLISGPFSQTRRAVYETQVAGASYGDTTFENSVKLAGTLEVNTTSPPRVGKSLGLINGGSGKLSGSFRSTHFNGRGVLYKLAMSSSAVVITALP